LRCGELIACDVTDVSSHSWHHTLALRTTKGDRPTVVALAPPTMQAIAATIGGRRGGPLLLNRAGRRMTTYNVQYLVAVLARENRQARDPARAPPQRDHHRANARSCVWCIIRRVV
jgi:hypothetical protein